MVLNDVTRPGAFAWHAVLAIVVLLSTPACKRSTEPTSNSPAPPLPTGGELFDFEGAEPGTLPPGFTAALTGGGGAVRWETQTKEDAHSGTNVVAQLSSDRTSNRYPHLVRDDFEGRDVDLSVSFRTLSGDVDASGGLVFRYQNPENYYVVRANALEGNVVAYKTENGKRSNIGVKGRGDAYGVKIPVPHRHWNTLRVIARGRQFEVFVNGRKLFEVEDDTFQDAGKLGLWTKADAVTQFDDLRAKALDPD